MKRFYYILLGLCLQHCSSVSYLQKHQLIGDIKSLCTDTFNKKNNDLILVETTLFVFTKNGRVKFSETFDANNNLLKTTQKKLWFTKQSFPNKEPYYCKTRWKPKQRERISCYTQKQYKQNEAIYYYNINGSIKKVTDNYTSFYTHYYHYNSNDELVKITIKNKDNALIDEIFIGCNQKDTFGNCIEIEKKATTLNTTTLITSQITYF